MQTVEGVELLDPNVAGDRDALCEGLSQATEIVTSLPSVDFYARGQASPASFIAQGLRDEAGPAALVYAAENHNHAAEMLAQRVDAFLEGKPGRPRQFLNTVIGKMSQVVTEPQRIVRLGLAPIAPGVGRAFLVEQFNRILVSRTTLDGAEPGIGTFIEKDDLLPFEEAKLYGHNAIHALLAYVGAARGHERMADVRQDAELMEIARTAFLEESGAALIARYAGVDPLFTPEGWRDYADDLLERMTNPWLDDTIERAGRDPIRKLGLEDRIFGTMQRVLACGRQPAGMALAAGAAVLAVLQVPDRHGFDAAARVTGPDTLTADAINTVLRRAWAGREWGDNERQLARWTTEAVARLGHLAR
jgi:mannitol-1-phosphate 5-dehydrogenase